MIISFTTPYPSEDGRIELNFSGNVLIVNPTKLSFHPIGENPEWWYFRLDTSSFNRSKVYEFIYFTTVKRASI